MNIESRKAKREAHVPRKEAPNAIGVTVQAQGRFGVGPIRIEANGHYEFIEPCKLMSSCRSPRSARAAITRWRKRTGLLQVVGSEVLTGRTIRSS